MKDSLLGDIVVKIITIKPQKRLSYQSHKDRDEYWQVLSGGGIARVNDIETTLGVVTEMHIVRGTKHRLENNNKTRDLIVLEISRGVFNEEDIVRYEDDYGRTS